ncbi:MAG TPA: hypothetical protein VGK63_11220 [Candidatus Limnocylindrales bacterium]
MSDVDEALLTILEDLVATIELRDAADPDVPRWEAEARVRRLEGELVNRFKRAESPVGHAPEVVLAGVF